MKIGIRLVVIIGVNISLGIGILTGASMMFARDQIGQLATENALNIARYNSQTARAWVEIYLDTSRTMADIMGKFESVPLPNRRTYCDDILKGVMGAHPEIVDVWTIWAPNAIDGMDAEFANTPGTDHTGRYLSMWSLDGSGNLRVEPSTGYETGDFYRIPMTGVETILDPFIYPVGGKNYLVTSLCVPVVDTNRRPVGVVGVDIELEVLEQLVAGVKPYGDGVAALFSNGGIVAAHFDKSRTGKDMRTTEQDMAGPNLDRFVQAIAQGKEITFPSGDLNVYSVPFSIGNTKTPWTLAIAVSRKTIMAPVSRLLMLSIVIGAGIILLTAGGAIAIARSISRPIVYTKKILKDVSEGDLTKQLTLTSRDEMAELADYINFTMGKIKDVVTTIKNRSGILSDTGQVLVENMTQTAASINEITANLQQIKTQAGNQSNSVTQANTAMVRVAENIDALNKQIERQTNRVAEASHAIEGMLENIQDVTQRLINNVDNVHNLAEASEAGRTGLQEVSEDIQEIARESEGLLEINGVMENIASQTNLLSMNAAIEAAHAGEAGKGFAVVADEIRKLAENSSEQSKTISTVLNKIKTSIDKITGSTNAVLLKFDAINDEVRLVTEQEQNIRNAMEEQGAGSKQILASMNDLIEISAEVKQGSQDMYEGSRNVMQEGKNLLQLTAEITNGIQEMAAGASQINGAVAKVNAISADNESQIEQLINAVSAFTVD